MSPFSAITFMHFTAAVLNVSVSDLTRFFLAVELEAVAGVANGAVRGAGFGCTMVKGDSMSCGLSFSAMAHKTIGLFSNKLTCLPV